MSKKIIEFECAYTTAKFAGYAYADELDDDEPLYFYDRNLGTQTSLQNAYCEGNEEDQIRLEKAFNEDSLLLQFLNDFQDDAVTIDRGDYTLHINGGEKFL